MTESHSFPRRDLIEKILRYQDLDSLCRLSVVLCHMEVEADGCSFFLLNAETHKLTLQESTVLTRYLGKSQALDLRKEADEARAIHDLLEQQNRSPGEFQRNLLEAQVDELGEELATALRGFGLTRWALSFRHPLRIDRIRHDIRWSRNGPAKSKSEEGVLNLCELNPGEIGSILVIPVGGGDATLPRGLLRVVRKRDRVPFGGEDLERMEWLAQLLDKYMEVAISLTDLMDLGTKLELEDFGETLVELLTRVLRAKGCSIFLNLERSRQKPAAFPCIATTGLFDKVRRLESKEVEYTIDWAQEAPGSLTGWVLRYGQHLALESTLEYDRSRYPGLRKPGPGQSSETDPASKETPGGPILISPLFLYEEPEPVGAIRVVRPPGEKFQVYERLLLIDISRRLSRVITNLRLRQVSEKLIKLNDQPDEMLRRVPREVCRLLKVGGCSVLRLHDKRFLRLEASSGDMKSAEHEPYDLEATESHGWSGWVARRKEPLLLNAPEEADEIDPEDPPRHSPQDLARPCEVGPRAERFLAVPILQRPDDSNSEVLGVIRVPRLAHDPPFNKDDLNILNSFSARLSLALNLTRRREQLGAVVEVSHPADPTKEPAQEIAERTAKVLTESVGFDFAAVYKLDDRTGQLELRLADTTRAELNPKSWRAHPYFSELSSREEPNDPPTRSEVSAMNREGRELVGEPEMLTTRAGLKLRRFVFPIKLGNLPLGTVEAGYGEEAEPKREIRARQKYIVRILANFCASAFYNEEVVRKLEAIRGGLQQIGAEIVAEKSLKLKLQRIADVAASVTHADNVIIFEYFGSAPAEGTVGGRFRESARGGPVEPSEWEEINFKKNAVPFRIVHRGEQVFASDAKRSEILFHRKNQGKNFIQRENIQSVAALPLNVGATCLGCIFFNYTSKQNLEDVQKQQEIRLMAEYAKVAIYQVRLVEEKSTLLRFADHSLSQTLNALMGYLKNLAKGVYRERSSAEKLADALADDAPRYQASEFSKLAMQQYHNTLYMTYLMKRFLSIDRVDTGLLRSGTVEESDLFSIKLQPGVNLSSLCEQVVKIAEAHLGGWISTNIEPNVIGRLDSDALQTAFLDVLVNAIKYGKLRQSPSKIDIYSGGIRMSLKTFDEKNKARWAEIRIEDPGPGIPESERSAVFELGYRKDRQTPGLGIGLFLTWSYVKVHQGKIKIEDSELGGACFIIHLPLGRRSRQDADDHDL